MRLLARPSITNTSTTKRFGTFPKAVFGFLAFCALLTLVGTKDVADSAGAIGVMIGATLAGVLFIKNAGALNGRERLGWSLVGTGMCVAALGVLVVGVVFLVQGDAPAFGWTDLFFLATYVLVLIGAAVLPQVHGSPMQRLRMVLDGLIGAVSIAALLWVLFLGEMTSNLADASMMTRMIGAFYPFLDLAILTVAMTVLLRRSRHRFDLRVALFAIAVFFQVLGDIAFFAAAQSGSFQAANPPYWVNLTAMGFFFASAWVVGMPTAGREYADRNPPLWTQVTPYVPAFGMLAVFVVETIVGAEAASDPILLPAVIVVGVLVIARQGVAILEYRATIEEQRDLLVTTISHELRTPLTAIVGFVDLLEEDHEKLDDDALSMLGIIREQADYMSTIVSDLIMLARGSDGSLNLEVEPVPVDELATAAIQATGRSPDAVGLEPQPDFVALVDRARMQQVLVNLLTNAARYGGSTTRLKIVTDDDSVTFEVHDDGPGVPRRHEVRVWERFERGPNRLNAVTPGSGIGLAIVRAIAEAHGGSASYRTSEILGGACFFVTVPGAAAQDLDVVAPDEEASEVRSIA